jgi:hypothetical protein
MNKIVALSFDLAIIRMDTTQPNNPRRYGDIVVRTRVLYASNQVEISYL